MTVINFFRKRLDVIIILSLFNFVFLGLEYLFDNNAARVTSETGVVTAQSYILAASVVGFLLFSFLYRHISRQPKIWSLIPAVCLFCGFFLYEICTRESHIRVVAAGCIFFVFLGILGSAAHYFCLCRLRQDPGLAKTIGCSYALGLLFQFLNNNVIHLAGLESFVLLSACILLTFLILRLQSRTEPVPAADSSSPASTHPKRRAGIALFVCILAMTVIFAGLDNVITYFHAEGTMDVGRWPRLLLALSGLTAGILFDIHDRRYMNLIMYCVTVLSVLCLLIILSGGLFLTSLIIFYLSAGFFTVFFTTSFMAYALRTNSPSLWAGFGRAANNIAAGVMGTISVTYLSRSHALAICVVALLVFVIISIALYLYSDWSKTSHAVPLPVSGPKEGAFDRFVKQYSLTSREQDVLQALLESDDSVQNIAASLYISRAALYRHIASINEKTHTKSRIGLLQFYYSWEKDDFTS